MNFPQICDVILRSSATRLQINRRVFKMGRKSKELSEDRKQLVVDLKREGHSNCEIVKLLHIPESTIRSIWKKYNSTGNVENIPRVGRPKKVTRRGEVRLFRTVKKESWQGFKINYKIFILDVFTFERKLWSERSTKRNDFLGVWNDGDGLLIYTGIK